MVPRAPLTQDHQPHVGRTSVFYGHPTTGFLHLCFSGRPIDPFGKALRVKRSLSQLSAKVYFPYPSVMVAVPPDLDLSEPSFGELDAYPLRRSRIICKATGHSRWEPKNSPPRIGIRIPGCKVPHELEMERENAEERRRRMDPIVRDGGQS